MIPEFFEFPPTRSNRVKWALHELGVEHVSRRVDFQSGAQTAEEYKAIHPLGRVPAYRTSQYTMQESVAIVMQLIDEHPEKGLAPPVGTPERAQYYQWCVLSCAELDHALFDVMKHTMHLPNDKRVPEIAERGLGRFSATANMLSDVLEDQNFLLGSSFSGADITIGYDCVWAKYVGILKNHPSLDRYYDRLRERPAFKQVFASDTTVGLLPGGVAISTTHAF